MLEFFLMTEASFIAEDDVAEKKVDDFCSLVEESQQSDESNAFDRLMKEAIENKPEEIGARLVIFISSMRRCRLKAYARNM